jgi:hypothetical protein
MNEEEARSVLIYAFIRELIENVSLLPLQNYLQTRLLKIPPTPLFQSGNLMG